MEQTMFEVWSEQLAIEPDTISASLIAYSADERLYRSALWEYIKFPDETATKRHEERLTTLVESYDNLLESVLYCGEFSNEEVAKSIVTIRLSIDAERVDLYQELSPSGNFVKIGENALDEDDCDTSNTYIVKVAELLEELEDGTPYTDIIDDLVENYESDLTYDNEELQRTVRPKS